MTNEERTGGDSALWSSEDAGLSADDEGLDAAGGDAEVEVEVIAAEIYDTRAGLGETIDEIGRRLEPGNVAREAGQSVRDATTRKVDFMTSGFQQTVDDVRRGDASGIVDTITRNPIPAAMVAVGLGLLFMNRGAQSPENGSYAGNGRSHRYGDRDWQRWPDQASPADRASAQHDRASSRISSAADDAGQSVQRFADDAGRRFDDLGDTVGQTASDVQHQAGTAVRRGTTEARRVFEENPLAVGAVAVAAGAAIGMLAPSTDAERRTLGPARDRFVDQAEQQVNEALDSMSAPAGSTTTTSTRSGSTSTRSTSSPSRSGSSGSTASGSTSSLGTGGTSTSRGNKSSRAGSAQPAASGATNQGGAPD